MFSNSVSRKSLALSGASLSVLGALLLAPSAFAQPVQLGPVTVQDAADKNALNRAPAIAMPSTSLQDTPQAVSVVSGETMRQQATTTLAEALRNVPGITIAIGEGGQLAGDQFRIRGFDAKDDVYLDGLRDFAAYTRDSFNYEEVQVLKGPSGLMFGRGTTGGAINTVSKTPFLENRFVINGEGGNGDHVRGTADWNHQLGETTALRLNAMFTDTGVVSRDLVHSHRLGLAASIATGLGTDTVLTASYIHQQANGRPDYGLPVAVQPNSTTALPVSEYGVPRNNFVQFITDSDKNTADIFTVKVSHVASDWLTIQNDFRAASYSRYFQYTTIDRCDATAATNNCAGALFGPNPQATLAGIGGGGPYQQDSRGLQDVFTATANFHVGGFRNMLVAGFDGSYQEANRTIYAYTLPPTSQFFYALGNNTVARTNIGMPLYNPTNRPPPGYNVVLPTPANVAGTNATATTIVNSKASATDVAVFLTDRLWLNEAWSVIAGVRLDEYKSYFDSTTVAGVTSNARAPSTLVNPRASLVYEPDGNTTVYFSYGQSAVPQGTSAVGSTSPVTTGNQGLRPEESETFELGAKYSLFDSRLGLTASLFQVTKANAVLTDPVSGNIQLQSGQKQRVQGLELSATGKITDDLGITASYTYLEPKITFDLSCTTTGVLVCNPNSFTIGRQIFFVPKNAASAWVDYNAGSFVPGLTVAGGVTYQSKLFNAIATNGTAPNPTGIQRIATIPETIQLDAMAAYDFGGAYRLQFNINNLTDRLNYSQSFGNRGTPSPGRTFIVSLGAAL